MVEIACLICLVVIRRGATGRTGSRADGLTWMAGFIGASWPIPGWRPRHRPGGRGVAAESGDDLFEFCVHQVRVGAENIREGSRGLINSTCRDHRLITSIRFAPVDGQSQCPNQSVLIARDNLDQLTHILYINRLTARKRFEQTKKRESAIRREAGLQHYGCR